MSLLLHCGHSCFSSLFPGQRLLFQNFSAGAVASEFILHGAPLSSSCLISHVFLPLHGLCGASLLALHHCRNHPHTFCSLVSCKQRLLYLFCTFLVLDFACCSQVLPLQYLSYLTTPVVFHTPCSILICHFDFPFRYSPLGQTLTSATPELFSTHVKRFNCNATTSVRTPTINNSPWGHYVGNFCPSGRSS